jgi:hypothetical protein
VEEHHLPGEARWRPNNLFLRHPKRCWPPAATISPPGKGTRRPWALYWNALFGLAWFWDAGESGSRTLGSDAVVHQLPLPGEVIDVLTAQAPGIKSVEPLKGIVPDHRWQGRDADRCRRKATVAKRRPAICGTRGGL